MILHRRPEYPGNAFEPAEREKYAEDWRIGLNLWVREALSCLH